MTDHAASAEKAATGVGTTRMEESPSNENNNNTLNITGNSPSAQANGNPHVGTTDANLLFEESIRREALRQMKAAWDAQRSMMRAYLQKVDEEQKQ